MADPTAAIEELAAVGRDLYASGLVTSHGGNLSLRRTDGGIWISTTGSMLGHLDAKTVVAIDAAGEPLDPSAAAPSSNTGIHVAVYAAHPEAGAVLHAHPPHAVAWTIAHDSAYLEPANFEARLFLGNVPVIQTDDEQPAALVAEALSECPVVLVGGHGSYALGVDLWDALRVTSALEEAAQILMLVGR